MSDKVRFIYLDNKAVFLGDVSSGRVYVGLDVAWRAVGVAVIGESGGLGLAREIKVVRGRYEDEVQEAAYLYAELLATLQIISARYEVVAVGMEDPNFLAAKLRGMGIAEMKRAKSVPTQRSIMLVAGAMGIALAAVGTVRAEDEVGDWQYKAVAPNAARAVLNAGLVIPSGLAREVEARTRWKGVKLYQAQAVAAKWGVLPMSDHVVDAIAVAWYVRSKVKAVMEAANGR